MTPEVCAISTLLIALTPALALIAQRLVPGNMRLRPLNAARRLSAMLCAWQPRPFPGPAPNPEHSMNVESICTRDVISLDGNEPLQRAALLMREHHVGAIVVTEIREGSAHVLGVVTDRDLAIELLARGGDASQVPVARLVQGPPIGIAARADLAEAVQAMQTAAARRLLVHDDDGLLVGVLSIDDLLPALVTPLVGLADVLRRGLQRELQSRGTFVAPMRPVLRVPAMGTAGWQAQATA